MNNYIQGFEDGVRATKAEYLKLLEEENTHPVKEQLTEIELEATFNRGYKEGAMDYASKCNPVKKQLTVEEILKVIKRHPFIDGYLNKNLIDFALAILQEASEK